MVRSKVNILIVIIVYIILAACAIKIYLPSEQLYIDDIIRDSEGNIYATESAKGAVFVYKMDAYGKAEDTFRCERESDEVETFCQYSGNAIYLAQVWYESGKLNFSVWRKDISGRYFNLIWKKSLEDDVKIEGIQVLGDTTICIIGIDLQTEDILLYYWQHGTDRLVRYDVDFTPICAYWGNNELYVLSRDNHIYYIDMDGKKTDTGIKDAVFLLTDDNGMYYQTKDSDDITYVFFNDMCGYTFHDMGDIWNIRYSGRAKNTAVLLYNNGRDRLLIVDQNGENGVFVDEFHLDFWKKVESIYDILLILTIIYSAVIIFMILFAHMVWNKRKLLYQTMKALIVFSGLWLVVTLSTNYLYERQRQKQDRLFLADTCMTIQKGRLYDTWDIGQFEYEDYLGSDIQKAVEKISSSSVMRNSWQSFFARQELIYGKDNPVFIFSEETPYARTIDTLYSTDAINYVKKCILTGENQNFVDLVDGISYAFAVTRIGTESQQLCLVSRVPMFGMEDTHDRLTVFYIIAALGWLLVMALIDLLLRNKWDHLKILVNQMDKVSRGDYHIETKKVPNNEFGTMWIALERMCKNLQIQRYRNNNILDYVYKFAPKNFERLFSKERLQDVEVGENIQISATMGLISVINKDVLLSGKVDRHYVKQLMEVLFSQKGAEQAVFLQNGSTLENVKIVFKEEEYTAIQAVKYSITCMEEIAGKMNSKYDTSPFILLHTAQFICGLGGGNKQVYPYVTSLELETLNTYVDELKNSGVRIAVTESTWIQVKDQLQGRYIGYVNSKNGQYAFKLYEILDACPQSQKLSKVRNKEKFEQALQLYYDNDLYLARNLFAEIFKECPQDGIAKWYVFACDELFNQETATNARHELFWK